MTALTVPPTLSDAATIAQLLKTFEPQNRADAVEHVIERAMIGYHHKQINNRSHNVHGDGSLGFAARSYGDEQARVMVEPQNLSDIDDINCLIHALQGIRGLQNKSRYVGKPDFQTYADTMDFCKECKGSGMVSEITERGTHLSETCDRCGGSGARVIVASAAE